MLGEDKARHRFQSFAPERTSENGLARIFIDGEDYFSYLEHAMRKATHEILIAGWFTSPEVLLVRPGRSEAMWSLIEDELTHTNTARYDSSTMDDRSGILEEDSTGRVPRSSLSEPSSHVKNGDTPDNIIPQFQVEEFNLGDSDTDPQEQASEGSRSSASDQRIPRTDKGMSRSASDASIHTSDSDMTDPVYYAQRQRLDALLLEKARQGVQIRMLIWNETKVALQINNGYAKRRFEDLHPNIRVLLHPGPFGQVNWTHHSKFVVVDSGLAFVGGIDLCYGRWDNAEHRVTDEIVPGIDNQPVWPGKDYYNEFFKALGRVDQPWRDRIDRTRKPRMPWHDIACCVAGEAAWDVALTFIQRWNHHLLQMNDRKGYDFMVPPLKDTTSARAYESVPLHRVIHGKGSVQHKMLVRFAKLFKRTALANRRLQVLNQHSDLENQVHEFLHKERMRHDLTMQTESLHIAASQLLENLWRPAYRVKAQVVRSLGPWSGSRIKECSIYNAYIEVIAKAKHYIYIENQYFCTTAAPADGDAEEEALLCTCSELQNPPEDNGDTLSNELDTPTAPKHTHGCPAASFTEPKRAQGGPRNRIGAAIYHRIARAIERKENFKVYVVIPVYPEGNFSVSVYLRYIIHLQHAAIYRGPNSIMGRLRLNYPDVDPNDYITFFSLRTYGHLNGNFVTEQIYVHSKMMLVDDRIAIVGSANINDRSMMGVRDSETCLVLEDTEMVDGLMGGQRCQVGPMVKSARLRAWAEHWNIDPEAVDDPVTDFVYHDLLRTRAQQNTARFENLFQAIPCDRLDRLTLYRSEAKILKRARQKKRMVLTINVLPSAKESVHNGSKQTSDAAASGIGVGCESGPRQKQCQWTSTQGKRHGRSSPFGGSLTARQSLAADLMPEMAMCEGGMGTSLRVEEDSEVSLPMVSTSSCTPSLASNENASGYKSKTRNASFTINNHEDGPLDRSGDIDYVEEQRPFTSGPKGRRGSLDSNITSLPFAFESDYVSIHQEDSKTKRRRSSVSSLEGIRTTSRLQPIDSDVSYTTSENLQHLDPTAPDFEPEAVGEELDFNTVACAFIPKSQRPICHAVMHPMNFLARSYHLAPSYWGEKYIIPRYIFQ
eukprot:Clim_evm12s169 gene=Clim_evmTU12s169